MEDTALRFCMKAEIVSLFSAETHEERTQACSLWNKE